MEDNLFAVSIRRATITAFAALSLTALSQAGLAANASDTGIWTVNLAQSKFGPGTNKLVIEAAGRNTKQNGASGGTFLVVSSGKVYLATDEATAATSATGVSAVDYRAWRGMKLIEIGNNVHSNAICSFRCQGGLPDNRPVILTFSGNGIDPRERMNSNVVVMDVR
jgi:hypothetical protein